MEIKFLVESALLTHGLVSVSDEELSSFWPLENANIAWVDKGAVKVGGMKEFLSFRRRADAFCRISGERLAAALEEGACGALTASGTMALCAKLGIPLAVSCGLGGIGEIRAELLCADLPALRDLPVVLIATAFKDMLNVPATYAWLKEAQVMLLRAGKETLGGYLFPGDPIPFDGVLAGILPRGKALLLNPIPREARILDPSLLTKGMLAGRQAEAEGKYYHPAANAAFDALTGGKSSKMQLYSLIDNVRLAQRITTDV